MHVTSLLPKLQYIQLQCVLVDAAVQIVQIHSVTSVDNIPQTPKETHQEFCHAIIFCMF